MLWKNSDTAANADIAIPAQFHLTPDYANTLLMFANSTPNNVITGETVGIFGVDANKMTVAALQGATVTPAAGQSANIGMPQHAGWVVRTLGSGGRAGRVMYETMVAMGSMTPTSNTDNTQLPEYFVSITSQPSSNTWNRGNVVNMIVVATAQPTGGGALTYYWQQDGGAAVVSWANVQNTGTFASANGNTSATLTIANNFIANSNTFRVIVGSAGANNKISANAFVIAVP